MKPVATAAQAAAHGWPLDDRGTLDAGLAAAAGARGFTFVVLPAQIAPASAIVAAWRAAPVVSWSARELTIVGVGAAHELRAAGADRWDQLVASARAIEHAGAVIGGASALDDAAAVWRPRLLGGLAFAPGAADRAPWHGFGDAWFVLPRWTYVHDGARAWIVLAVTARDAEHRGRWHDELAALRGALAAGFTPRPQPPMVRLDAGDAEAWRTQIRAITDAIGRGECAKIVAARSAVVTLAGEPRLADLLSALDERHGDCARVLVRPSAAGALIAATPERLVRVDGETIACDALAGSRALGEEVALLASGKDRREHALVVDAIASVLHELGADVTRPAAPAVRALRHVLHLHTPIAARLRAPRHLLEVAARLHPTPAVGGTPTAHALAWIAANEAAARGWYAAPVGWFDLAGNGELAVAIRSGVLAGDRAQLWAGAGIVAGSDPDRERAETDIKLRAMLGALGVPA